MCESEVVESEVVGLVVGVVGEDCLREMEIVDENYLMKVAVVAEGCLLDDPTRFGATISEVVIIKFEGDLLEFLDHNVHS